MSDSSISIVPRKSNYPNNKATSESIVRWLISQDIIKAELSDCVLGYKEGYAISEGAGSIVTNPEYLPFKLMINGLQIITEQQIFDTGQNGLDQLICPNCDEDISSEDRDFFDQWSESGSGQMTCPLCSETADIHTFKFVPEWGFSNIGFSFWNWPDFKESFLEEFKQRLGCDISIIYQHI